MTPKVLFLAFGWYRFLNRYRRRRQEAIARTLDWYGLVFQTGGGDAFEEGLLGEEEQHHDRQRE